MIVYGTFDGLEDADENLYIYTRSSENKNTGNLQFHGKRTGCSGFYCGYGKRKPGNLIGNYKDISEKIRPYEAVVYLTK